MPKNKVLYRQNDVATDMRILLHGAVKLTAENVKGIGKGEDRKREIGRTHRSQRVGRS